MRAKFENENNEIEILDTDNLENDSGENWNEENLTHYILDVCPIAKNIEIYENK